MHPQNDSMTNPPAEVLEEWRSQQDEMKQRLVEEDQRDWQKDGALRRVGGVDISFAKDSAEDGCATLIVLEYPSLEVLYERTNMIRLTQPYIPGYLAFREVPFMAELVRDLQHNSPELVPDVVMVDGNGLLHPRGFGSACHLGIATGLPTIGVAKNFLQVDGLTLKDMKARLQAPAAFPAPGATQPIVGNSGRTWGLAMRTTQESSNPVFVSVGHMISLASAAYITKLTAKNRVPEAIRQADLRSRQYLRDQGML